MHIKLPEKMDRVLQYLKLKIFPNTLFFRTMLMIFIPLILVQVVSVIAFFNGNWERSAAACRIICQITLRLRWK